MIFGRRGRLPLETTHADTTVGTCRYQECRLFRRKTLVNQAVLPLGLIAGPYNKNGRPSSPGAARFLTRVLRTSVGNRASTAAPPGSGSADATADRTCC